MCPLPRFLRPCDHSDWVYQIMKEFDKTTKKDKTKMPTAEFNNLIKKNNQYFDTSEEALIVESNYFKFVN